jgi:uncharacterized protein with PIN domain
VVAGVVARAVARVVARLVAALERAPVRLVSAATIVEASLVLLGRFGTGHPLLFVGDDFTHTDVVAAAW